MSPSKTSPKFTPFLIGVCGGSGSGKTTLVKNILNEFQNHSVTYIPHDDYYRDFPKLTFEEKKRVNYDHPNSLETKLLVRHLNKLLEGKTIKKPTYDFVTYSRTEKTEKIAPTKIVILEGLLLFEDVALRNIFDLKVFVDADPDIRLARRIERDIKERGRTFEYSLKQYQEFTRPMHLQFIEPNKRYADILIPEGGHNAAALELLYSRIKSILQK